MYSVGMGGNPAIVNSGTSSTDPEATSSSLPTPSPSDDAPIVPADESVVPADETSGSGVAVARGGAALVHRVVDRRVRRGCPPPSSASVGRGAWSSGGASELEEARGAGRVQSAGTV